MTAPQIAVRTDILWSGENSFIMLKPAPDAPASVVAGYFQVDYSPEGSGHVLVIEGDLGGAGRPEDRIRACYGDNAPLAAWILREVARKLPEFEGHDLAGVEVAPARFGSHGDTQHGWTEIVTTAQGEIRMHWWDFQAPFKLIVPAGAIPTFPNAAETCMHPAASAELSVFGRRAAGGVHPADLGGQAHSTAFLALSEVWFKAS